MGRLGFWTMVILLGAAATCGEPREPQCASACLTARSCGLLPSRLGQDYEDCVSSCELIDSRDREDVLRVFAGNELSEPDIEICADLARELADWELGLFRFSIVTIQMVDRDLYYEIVGDPWDDNHVQFCLRSDECAAPKTCDARACSKLGMMPPIGCEAFEGLEIELGVRLSVPMGAMLVETEVSKTFTCNEFRTIFETITPQFGSAVPYVRLRGGMDGPTFCHEVSGRRFDVGPGASLALVPTPRPELLIEAQETMASCDLAD